MESARLRRVLLRLPPLLLHQREPNHCLRVCRLLVSMLFLHLCLPECRCGSVCTSPPREGAATETLARSLTLSPSFTLVLVLSMLSARSRLHDAERAAGVRCWRELDRVRDGVGAARAWHPRAWSWVPLPVAKCRSNILRRKGLASLLPFLGCYAGVFQPLHRLCLRVALAPSLAWPRSGRALRLLLGKDHDVVGGFSSFLSVVHGFFGAPLSSRFWGRWGWRHGIFQFFHGCRKCYELPRGCAVDWGSSEQGAWHPLAPTWVPGRGCLP